MTTAVAETSLPDSKKNQISAMNDDQTFDKPSELRSKQPQLVIGSSFWPYLSLSPPENPQIELPEESPMIDGKTSPVSLPVLEIESNYDFSPTKSSSNFDSSSVSIETENKDGGLSGFGDCSNSEPQNIVVSSTLPVTSNSMPASVHSSGAFNHNNNQNHPHNHTRFGSRERRTGFKEREGNRWGADGFQNQGWRHQTRDWMMSSQHQPHGNGQAGFLGPPSKPMPQYHFHNSSVMINSSFMNGLPLPLPPPPPPPPPLSPGYMNMMPMPFEFYDPYFPETNPYYAHQSALLPLPTPIRPPIYPQPLNNLPYLDVELLTAIRRQIEYYFSEQNLVSDYYLRTKMDNQGWVSVHLIAGFKRVKAMTSNISLVLQALQPSTIVEVQGAKMRRHGDWKRWIVPPRSSSTQDMLVDGIQNIQLNRIPGAGEAPKTETSASARDSNTIETVP